MFEVGFLKRGHIESSKLLKCITSVRGDRVIGGLLMAIKKYQFGKFFIPYDFRFYYFYLFCS